MMGMVVFKTTTRMVLVLIIISPCIFGKEFSDVHELKVQRLLKRLNKPALKSIKSEDGDIIDCVPITSQPALDHPLLKNHTIQMRPTFIPEAESKFTKKEANTITQLWRKSGECSENTVSIRRIKKEDILRAKSIKSFGKKTYMSIPQAAPSRVHEYAVTSTMYGHYYGTNFVMNIWKPEVEDQSEFSLAQTWLISGRGTEQNTIEAGWQVYPRKYGDKNIRLFVYWRNNVYLQGCYNLDCPGFVQRSNIYTVGGSLTPVSQYNGTQSELSMLIWKDAENWWLKIGEELVGYWPDKLFYNLQDGANIVQWGGEITNAKPGGRHTATDMGSGHFASKGYTQASYFKKIMTIDKSNALKTPLDPIPLVTNASCYSLKPGTSGDPNWGTHFFFGGPGQNSKCV